MPQGLLKEGGFQSVPNENASASPHRKRDKFESLIADNQAKQRSVTELITKVTESNVLKSSGQEEHGTPDIVTYDCCQHRAKKCFEIKREMNEDSDLDDDTKKR